MKYDDFQSGGSVGDTVYNNSTAGGAAWNNNTQSNNTIPIFSTAQLRSGTPFTRNMRARWNGNPTGSSSLDSSNLFVASQVFTRGLFCGWTYMDTSLGYSGLQNIKVFRFHNTNAGSPNIALATPFDPAGGTSADWTYQVDGAGVNPGFNTGPSTAYALNNRWIQSIFLFDLGSGNGTSTGSGRSYIDCLEVMTFDNQPISASGVFSLPECYVGNYAGNVSWTGAYQEFWECVYIDDTWARVEIGNNAVYDSCTHREIQIPSAWTGTSITFTANRGSFSSLSGLYLFVIDANNVASPGFLMS